MYRRKRSRREPAKWIREKIKKRPFGPQYEEQKRMPFYGGIRFWWKTGGIECNSCLKSQKIALTKPDGWPIVSFKDIKKTQRNPLRGYLYGHAANR